MGLTVPRRAAGDRMRAAEPVGATVLAGPLGHTHLDVIDQSHARCAALGLSRIAAPELAPLGHADLQVLREAHRRLHAHAMPIMEMLHEQIVDTGSMVVLCDATGTIIHRIGDDDFLARASKVALAPGVNWSEPSKGTNAIGTALVDEAPTLVHGAEHFMHANHFLTCSAAPIVDPRGNLLGVLDVTGDHRGYHPHTMALVRMSALMIENHWLTEDFQTALRVHFHPRADRLGTLTEGILACSTEGEIVGANRVALQLLGVSGVALRRASLASLLGTTVGRLVDHFRAPKAPPMVLHLPEGQPIHARAHFDWPSLHASARGTLTAAVEAAPAPVAAARGDTGSATSSEAPPLVSPSAAASPSLQDVQADTIRRALQATQGNLSEASRRLGVSRNTLYRKLRRMAAQD